MSVIIAAQAGVPAPHSPSLTAIGIILIWASAGAALMGGKSLGSFLCCLGTAVLGALCLCAAAMGASI